MAWFGTAALFLSAALGAALLAVFLMWYSFSTRVRKRVEVLVGLVAAHARESGEIPVQRTRMDIFKRLFTLGMPRKWGVAVKPNALALVGVAAGGAAWLLIAVILGVPTWLTMPFVVLAAWLGPHIVARLEQGRSDQRFVDLFPEAIDMIVRMLRASLPVSAAIRTVAKEAPAPINGVFASLADQIDIGISFEDALEIGSERIGLPDFRFFAAAVALQHTTGGNLVSTLETLGEIIRRRHAVRLKAKATTAEVRISAYVLGAMPFCVFGALLVTNPEYLTPLLVDRRGNIMLVIAVALLAAAFLTMRHMMRGVLRP